MVTGVLQSQGRVPGGRSDLSLRVVRRTAGAVALISRRWHQPRIVAPLAPPGLTVK